MLNTHTIMRCTNAPEGELQLQLEIKTRDYAKQWVISLSHDLAILE